MRLSFLTLLGSCLLSVPLGAQTDPGLSASTTGLEAVQKRIDSLTDLSFDSLKVSSRRAVARKYALEAQKLANGISYPKGMGDSFMRLGKIEADEGRWQESLASYRQALHIRASLGDLPGTASCYNMLGDMYKLRGDFDSAAISFSKGIVVMKDQDIRPIVLQLYANLGHIYSLTGKYAAAKTTLDSALQLCVLYANATNGGGRELMADARMNLAELLQTWLYQTSPARDSLLKCLEDYRVLQNDKNIGKCLLLLGNNAYYRYDMDTAREFYQKGLDLGDKISDVDFHILRRNRGRTYLDQGRFDKALTDFKTSLAAFQQLGNQQETAGTMFELGNFYNERSNLDSAIQYYKSALAYDIQAPTMKGRLLYFLSDVLYQLGHDAEAQRFNKEYVTLLEQLTADQTKGAFAEMMQHFIDKNRLQRRMIVEEKQDQRTYGLIALTGLALLVVLALLFARFQRQKRRLAERNAEIARQQEEIARQNEQLAIREKLDLLKNKELETNYARLAGQDDMQRRIGQELHDGVGAMLASVKINLSPVDEVLDQLPEDKQRQYTVANRLLDEASEELRRISHELSSALLTKFGLKAQLEALADIIAGPGKLQVELATHGLRDRLDYRTELNIYRMVQELVQNIVKHAQARTMTIAVNRFENGVNVMVEDDGRGFDPEALRTKSGLGLQNLSARVHELQGELHLDTRPGHGTSVSIDIPIKRVP